MPTTARFYLALALSLPLAVVAENTAETETKLEAVEQHIENLRERMEGTQANYDRFQTDLRQTEKAIGALARNVETLTNTLTEKEQELKKLSKRQKNYETDLQQQRQQLAKQIRASYIVGRQDYLKVLLNQEDPVSIGRVLTYYDYFNQARVRQIEEIG
ncbi:MAG: hypothetical protein AAF512_02805, partial [Pseudomonadota bacterium]